MKLEIDTERDSKATLRGVMRMLQAILGEDSHSYSNRPIGEPRSRNIFEDDSPSVSMYGDDSSSSSSYPSSSASADSSSGGSSSGGLFSMFGDPSTSSGSSSSSGLSSGSEISEIKEDDDDLPQIQVY